jgi:hypothetical protein
MGKTTNSAKTKWNSEHYAQIKFYVSKEIAEKFKTECAAAGVSMACVLKKSIAEYSQAHYKTKPLIKDYVSTKKKRRKAIDEITYVLGQVRDAQETARDNIPDSFQDSDTYESAENSIEVMDEVIDRLGDIYG